ncbi:MAG: hypothetical protein RQ750_06525 [Roseovarius sp.]|nr:hypothetical protein [Roseovarius sp.]
MPISSSIRIFWVSRDRAQSVESAVQLDRLREFNVTRADDDTVEHELAHGEYDILILDVGTLEERDSQLLKLVRLFAPNQPLIILSDVLDADSVRQILQLNAQDLLQKPISHDKLVSSIKALVRAGKTRGKRVHAIVSVVGGAGATTIAASMADIAVTRLLRKTGSVALFDLDFSTGNCGYILNLNNSFDLGSVAPSPQRVDAEFIRAIQLRHKKGFYLYSFKRPDLNTDINGYELTLRMLDAVTQEHEHTFLDIPYYETEWKDDVLSAVNTCTLVTEQNLPAIKHTLDVVQRIKSLRGSSFPVRIILNKHVGGWFRQRIATRKLRDLFEDVPFFYLPLLPNVIGEAIDRGILPSDVAVRNKFDKALVKYMKSIELTDSETG